MLSLAATFYGLKFLGPFTIGALEKSITHYLDAAGTMEVLTTPDLTKFFLDGCVTFALAAMPLLLIASAVTVAGTVAQTRGLFTMKSAAFKMSRLNPIQGLRKLFSLRGVIELIKSLLKIGVLTYIIYTVLADKLRLMPRLMDMGFEASIAYTGGLILEVARLAAIIMAFVAAFDYLYQWWDYEKNLRMSKQELKEEYKQTEGDPQIKGKIKERQQQQARRRMMQNVPNADVVIRNPTHFAVAIQYDPQKNNAPVVIAKGADSLALRIVSVAEQHEIVVTENKPLARGLYEAVEIGQEIPDRFYQPVAEVLAFVYSLKKKELKQLETI